MTDINSMTGRNWEVEHELVDVAVMLKKYRNLQYDADFEENIKDYNFYKARADYYQELFDKGQEHDPQF
ncbi:MAG: hypothetical protein CMJ25_03335 [Phycisphaerae bacterium]|jgi:hypothetical protein|nr:hypothetical protein [Phycisphaerae bacterium]|tara:strand:+ start:857 stop:1063 length:207 start_codon:yes stop_codon:yes gene_type:complete